MRLMRPLSTWHYQSHLDGSDSIRGRGVDVDVDLDVDVAESRRRPEAMKLRSRFTNLSI